MFDTHCHLNFSVFKKNLSEVIDRAKKAGINQILIPGTDVFSSKRAVEIANQYEGVYAGVAIHPHHIFQYQKLNTNDNHELNIKNDLVEIEKLLVDPKVMAIGEVGLDKHIYKNTKYEKYMVDKLFIKLQESILERQIKMVLKYDKSLIIHNWEAKTELLNLLNGVWDKKLEEKVVFHCCEANDDLLNYAKEHKIYIGVDGDVTFNKQKQEFVKKVPLGMLVLETDSPYLLPEPLRSQKLFPNEPKNIRVIIEYISKLKGVRMDLLTEITTNNAETLFQLDK